VKASSYSKYKGSGVQWLGQIPAHWQAVPFKTLLARNDSGVWGNDPDGESDAMVLRSTEQNVDGSWNIDDPAWRKLSARERDEALLREADLVVTKSSGSQLHIGKTSYVNDDVASLQACFSNFMQRLRLKPGNVPRLYWHLMNSPVCRQQFVLLSTTTTGLGNLNGGIIGAVTVPAPPSAEQQAIADFLDRETAKIDALVEKKARLIELLQEKRIALITHAVTNGLDPNVPMKDSGIEWLGQIPAHWKVKKLSWLIRASNAGEVVDRGYWGEGNELLYSCQRTPVWSTFDRFPPERRTQSGDILVTRNGTPYVHLPEPGSIYTNVVQRVQLSSEMTTNFAHTVLSAAATTLVGFGDIIESFNMGTWRQLGLPLPPAHEQKTICAFVDCETEKIDALIAKVGEAIESLKEYRTALISAAVTGKIDVREIPSIGGSDA